MESGEGEPWPVGRIRHAACCLGYAGDHIHLLVTGGGGRNGKVLKDVWLFNLSLKKWKEVSISMGAKHACSDNTLHVLGTSLPRLDYIHTVQPKILLDKSFAQPTLWKYLNVVKITTGSV